jgi:hypothetical protein
MNLLVLNPSGRWSLDGKKVYFEWNPNNELGTDTYFGISP